VNILEKLHLAAALVLTGDKKGLAAFFAYVRDKGLRFAMRAGDMKRTAAAGAYVLALIDDPKTGGAKIREGAPVCRRKGRSGRPGQPGCRSAYRVACNLP
jgi:hypothetical protein